MQLLQARADGACTACIASVQGSLDHAWVWSHDKGRGMHLPLGVCSCAVNETYGPGVMMTLWSHGSPVHSHLISLMLTSQRVLMLCLHHTAQCTQVDWPVPRAV